MIQRELMSQLTSMYYNICDYMWPLVQFEGGVKSIYEVGIWKCLTINCGKKENGAAIINSMGRA